MPPCVKILVFVCAFVILSFSLIDGHNSQGVPLFVSFALVHLVVILDLFSAVLFCAHNISLNVLFLRNEISGGAGNVLAKSGNLWTISLYVLFKMLGSLLNL